MDLSSPVLCRPLCGGERFRCLLEHGAELDAGSSEVLLVSVEVGDKALAKRALDAGVSPVLRHALLPSAVGEAEDANPGGGGHDMAVTPWLYACMRGATEFVEVFLEHAVRHAPAASFDLDLWHSLPMALDVNRHLRRRGSFRLRQNQVRLAWTVLRL